MLFTDKASTSSKCHDVPSLLHDHRNFLKVRRNIASSTGAIVNHISSNESRRKGRFIGFLVMEEGHLWLSCVDASR